jgi:serine/threonine protein kinase/HAMP domain-containing protein
MDKSTKPTTSQTGSPDETLLTELALVDPLCASMDNAPDEDRTHFGSEINPSRPNESAFERTVLLASAAADQPPPPDSDRTVPRVALATPAVVWSIAEEATVLLRSQTVTVASLPPTLVTRTVLPPQVTDPVPADVPASITPAAPVLLTPTSLALPLGFRLYEYRIDSVLGQGGFGITYLATDIHLNAKVAIKEYLPEDFANRSSDKSVSPRREEDREFYQNGLDNFLVEARTLATFRHPNIVRVARFFEANASAYMVLEYERGKSLKAWWRNRREMPEEELLTLLLPLLDGLAVVHNTGYLHRDIKPDNIYVREEDGSLVLLDFGAALQTAAGSDGMSGVVTPGYGPIEQYENGNQGPWTDIYAIGATLYAMVTGKKPPPAPTRLDAEDPMLPAVDACKGQYSPEFLRAIDWALQPRAQDRPQDIASFTEALFAAHASALNLQAALKAGEGSDEADGRQALMRGPRSAKGKLSRFARTLGQPRSWPMALKMTLAMVLTALMPMLITAYYNLNGSLAVVSTSELRNLEQLAQSTAGRVSQFIKDSRNLAAYLGTDEDFVQFFEAPSDEGKRSISRKLEELMKANSDVNLLIVMDTLGTALIVGGDQAVTGGNFKFREYFQVAMQGQPYTTGILVGSVAGGAGVFYSTPVFGVDRQVIGVVVLRIKAASITTMLEEIRQGSSQRIPFMIDGDGVIIHHPQPEMLYRSLAPLPQAVSEAIVADQRFRRDRVDSLDMPDLAQAMIGAKTVGNIDYTSAISGQQEIAGFAPVSSHNWVIGVTESRAFFTEPLNALFANVLYSVILVGFVFLVLALLFTRTIVKPIRELNDAAHALKAGDYDRAVITVTSRDEIGQLAHTFNVMIDVLRQRERERERGSISRRTATVRKPDRGEPE